MSVLSTDPPTPGSARFVDLPAELADGITEAVTRPHDAEKRSAVICTLVREMYESIEWLYGSDTESAELASLAKLTTAARNHQDRMARVRPVLDESG